MTTSWTTAVLVPVKAFAAAKLRLAPALPPEGRRRLAAAMAERVLRAAGGLHVAVVCDDAEVADWAAGRGAEVIWTPARGLNAAVAEGVTRLADAGADVVAVVHADLPAARDLGPLGAPDVVALAPDRRRDGTNVAVVPARCGFRFAYGPGSFERHRREAGRLGLPVQILDRADLAWDVDVPADLAGLGDLVAAPAGAPGRVTPATGAAS